MLENATVAAIAILNLEMSEITIIIQDEHLQKLQDTADRLGISIENLLLMSVEELINRQEQTFKTATDYVLQKNVELYQRLA